MKKLADLSAMIEEGLQDLDYPIAAATLYDPIRYTLDSGGKRLRPTLVLIAASLYNDDIQAALKPALGIEMYHNFTLLHDDVMDKAPTRRGRPTVHVKWNDNQAILSGDAMEGLAYQLIAEDNVTIDEYIEMIRLKTSVLLGRALQIGAYIGQDKQFGNLSDIGVERYEWLDRDIDTLFRFGTSLGLAFQLQDDWLDCWGDPKTFGKRIGGDILENKKTFLRITALANAPEPNTEGMSEQQKIETYKAYYKKTGAEKACRLAIANYHQEALQALQSMSIPMPKLRLLKEIAAKLEKREK